MNFTETTITLHVQKGRKAITKTYPGKELHDTGLGYWIAPVKDDEPAFYAPTHLPTGRRIADEPFFSEVIAQQYLEAIAPLFNWNQPCDQLVATPGYQDALALVHILYQRFHFEDMAQTAMGGRV